MDPSLRGILDSSAAFDDNDLYLSNVIDTRILAIHGYVVHPESLCFPLTLS